MNALNAIHNNGIPGANLNAFVNALMGQVLNQQPLAQLPAQLLNQVKEIVRNHILALAGTLLSATGLAVLLPTLTGIIVNALGFTSAGVVAGTFAALFQSQFYGAFTGGLFSLLQSIGATAVVASPAVLVPGGISLGVGAVFFGRWLWNRYRS